MTTTLRILTYIGKAAGILATFNTIPFVDPATGALIFFIASLAKDTVNRIGDFTDDGTLNNSFPTKD